MAAGRPPVYAAPVNTLETAIAAADAAGAVIRPFFRRPLAADQKPDRSPVTQADRAAEHAMRSVIAQRHPEHEILGEEAGLDQTGSSFCWVLDPIDGTRAFITGRPTFGTLIALLRNGAPILGIIDQPITGERWIGIAGEPTRFRGPFGGTPRTRACGRLEDAELSATSPDMLGDAWPRWQRLSRATRRTSWGGDCYAYGLLALGQIDIVAERDLKIWDWAALVPVVEGAGGRVVDWRGQKLNVASGGEVIAVGDAAILAAALVRLAG